MDQTYNGYKNYETWCVALWINNDEVLQRSIRELANEHQIESYIEELRFETNEEKASMFSDILSRSIARVDWEEVHKATRE